MNKEQRAALRKLAEEAKLGPWKIGAIESDMVAIDSFHDLEVTGFIDSKDAAFLLAANPSTILAMLDYIEMLEKDAARYQYLRDDGEGFDISVLERDTEDGELWVHGYPPEELEAAIDAAMQGETE